jgi:peptidoglycan-N-acetylglucosamine deacetylase
MIDKMNDEVKSFINKLLWSLTAFKGGSQRTHKKLEEYFPGVLWGSNNSGCKKVYLTFDDGPDPDFTPRILDVLKKYNVKATFFLQGEKIPPSLELIDRILAEDHQIGYHGLSHEEWWFKKSSERKVQMDPKFACLNGNNPFNRRAPAPLLLRPPYGRFDYAVLHTASQMGAKIVNWRLVVGDWVENRELEDIASALIERVKGGDIVVLHDGGINGDILSEVLERVIPMWKTMGLECGNILELMESD